jgi:NAD(P)-dependent dehydrogenase (short-subunit alcohol dehydrogenase family)
LSESTASSTTVFIAAISSDIGQSLARAYRARGWQVIGTYRDASGLGALAEDQGVCLIQCDVADTDQIDAVARGLAERGAAWDMFVGAVGQLAPIGPFFKTDRRQWLRSAALNGTGQLALLHALHPFRRACPLARVAFLVGGAINRAFSNYSAYSLGKIDLVKFCELIHNECHDIHAVAVGTGWVATKIHRQTLEAGDLAGDNLAKTRGFLSTGERGTSVSDIVACLDWCFAQDRDVTGGRNFSVVHDAWRDGGAALSAELRRDDDKFKLRRHGNSVTVPTVPA